MRRSLLLVATAVVVAMMAAIPLTEATHQWGHRYMIFGRVLDSAGQPAQLIDVTVTVETTHAQHPWMIVPTDCSGLYYSLERTGDRSRGFGLEAGRMHIHNPELPSDSQYTVSTQWGSATGQVRPQLKFSNVNLDLDEDTPARPECDDASDWTKGYVVVGHVQEDRGNERVDIQTVRLPDQGVNQTEYIDVTLETTNGTVNQTVEIGQLGDYFAFFENVTVEEGARVTATYGDETRTGSADLKYRLTEVSVVVKNVQGGKTLLIMGAVVGGAALLGAAAYGVSTLRQRMETQRAIGSSTRKRANR